MTGSQQAPESSLLFKGNYKRSKNRVGFVQGMQNQCLTSMGAKFVFLTTVLPSMLDQEQTVPTWSYELAQVDTKKHSRKSSRNPAPPQLNHPCHADANENSVSVSHP